MILSLSLCLGLPPFSFFCRRITCWLSKHLRCKGWKILPDQDVGQHLPHACICDATRALNCRAEAFIQELIVERLEQVSVLLLSSLCCIIQSPHNKEK